jgi:anti-anti-sigma factor
MAELATVVLERRSGALVVRLFGEIDLSNAEAVDAELTAGLGSGREPIVVDLSELAYVDSAGIRLLFQLGERLGAEEREFRLAVPETVAVRRILHVSGIESVLPIHPSVESALATVTEVSSAG